MNWKPASRIESVQTPVIPVVGEWIAQHPGTISLGQGIVHYAPPPRVAAVAAGAAGQTRTHRYGLVRGIEEFLEAVGDKLADENGIRLDGSQIVCTAGSNMGFMNALFAIADEGDEIILLAPYYFNHEMAIRIAGCVPVIVPTTSECQVDVPRLAEAVTPRTRAIVTVSPNNPTGAVYPKATLVSVNQLCRDRGIFHISDEAYEYFTYGAEHYSPASDPNVAAHTISLFSLSKAYGMAGWRVAYMVIPQQLETPVKKAQDTNLVCPPIISQIAGTAALEAGREWCLAQIETFQEVRDLVLDELRALGDQVRVPQPDGEFYTLVYPETQKCDMELVQSLIRDFGVATLPGGTFGIDDRCAIRIAYGALNRDSVASGMGRLVRGFRELL